MVKVELSVLMMFFVIFNRVKFSIDTLSKSYLHIRETMPNIHRYTDLLDMLDMGRKNRVVCEDMTDSSVTLPKIEMREVSFQYDNEFVLDNVNFKAYAGDRILIQGPSGHGKSTFLEVLCGLLPPSKGMVLYNGESLDENLFYKMRSHIAYVSPTVYLFKDTLKANLLIGCPEKEKDLDRVLKLSGLDEVVSELPNGLDSYIGTDGDALSLGERQRVILARLYLKNPRLVLLDEATANLDKKLEEEIIRNLLSYIDAQAILIIIAHKEPAGINFNKQYRIENGKLEPLLIYNKS